jgi:signal transduction histidine kinase
MTCRILAALLILTLGLLLGAILPLGLAVTAQEKRDFRAATLNAARSVASAAEERLVDHESAARLSETLSRLRSGDESVIVTNGSGHPVVQAGPRFGNTTGLVAAALRGRTNTLMTDHDDQVVVAIPVYGHNGGIAGTVMFGRPREALDRRVRDQWMLFGIVAVGAVGLALLLAVALARWVGRPLRELGRAAEELGGGQLGTRAPAERGPGEVRQLAGRFNVMAARLETLIYDHRVVLEDVAHQLRTPLAALRLRLELMTDEAEPQTAADLDCALDELARLSRLVDGLLAIARAENTTDPLVPVPLREALTERAEAWLPVATERRVELTADVPHGDLAAMAGAGHIEQVIDNLVDNALTAAPEDGRVRITARGIADRVRITVADNGPGMPEPEREQAFRRFETGRASGTGLGLAIVHRLVTADGGQVSLDETPGGGLTVTLVLSAADARTRSPGS